MPASSSIEVARFQCLSVLFSVSPSFIQALIKDKRDRYSQSITEYRMINLCIQTQTLLIPPNQIYKCQQ